MDYDYLQFVPREIWEEIFAYLRVDDIQNLQNTGVIGDLMDSTLKSKRFWYNKAKLEGIPDVYLEYYNIIYNNRDILLKGILPYGIQHFDYFYMHKYDIMKAFYNKIDKITVITIPVKERYQRVPLDIKEMARSNSLTPYLLILNYKDPEGGILGIHDRAFSILLVYTKVNQNGIYIFSGNKGTLSKDEFVLFMLKYYLAWEIYN